jgi:hypothetical protein
MRIGGKSPPIFISDVSAANRDGDPLGGRTLGQSHGWAIAYGCTYTGVNVSRKERIDA